MIKLSKIRKEPYGEWTKLVCDLTVTEIDNPFQEDTIWFAVKNENADMFSVDTYDAFLLVPWYLAMYYKTNLKIEGNVSKILYRNMLDYGQHIMKNFSPDLVSVDVEVDGYDTVSGPHNLIGTGISCGVDSLSVIFDRYEREQDPEYKINSLFIFNSGTHGHYENKETYSRFIGRAELNQAAADDMNLPMYLVDSNLHSFTHTIAEQKLGYFAIYSCVLSVQKVLKKYYVASSYSYDEVMKFHDQAHDFDFAEFAESYFLPLVCTENVQLILQGGDKSRSKKTESIADWEIAQKHLNVCLAPAKNAKNCSCCSKCMRTLVALEAIGKLDDFSKVFDLERYQTHSYMNKIEILINYEREGFATDNVNFARENNMKLPGKSVVCWHKAMRTIKISGRRLVGNKFYDFIRRICGRVD